MPKTLYIQTYHGAHEVPVADDFKMPDIPTGDWLYLTGSDGSEFACHTAQIASVYTLDAPETRAQRG